MPHSHSFHSKLRSIDFCILEESKDMGTEQEKDIEVKKNQPHSYERLRWLEGQKGLLHFYALMLQEAQFVMSCDGSNLETPN